MKMMQNDHQLYSRIHHIMLLLVYFFSLKSSKISKYSYCSPYYLNQILLLASFSNFSMMSLFTVLSFISSILVRVIYRDYREGKNLNSDGISVNKSVSFRFSLIQRLKIYIYSSNKIKIIIIFQIHSSRVYKYYIYSTIRISRSGNKVELIKERENLVVVVFIIICVV